MDDPARKVERAEYAGPDAPGNGKRAILRATSKGAPLMGRTGLASLLCLSMVAAGGRAGASESRPMSPRGMAATQLGGKWLNPEDEDQRHYEGGKWIEVDYGRPLLRGRPNIFGTGAAYGKAVNAGAPVWRLGANQATKLKTEAALELGGKKVPAGEYALFVSLQPGAWTLIVSSQKTADKYDPKDKSKIWGSYGYDPKFDVARIPMTVSPLAASVDELTIQFEDVTDQGGKLAVLWDKTRAVAPFAVTP
jgi:hypothetical protein